ncbi:MAG TPA: thioredoxin family protein [Bacilli bacterium]|nr:thioredoxin family protein [Bacilli bacterium]
MNKIFDDINKEYNFEVISYDYDFDNDEVSKYNIGKILPVFIFLKDNKEVLRIIGEKDKQEFINLIKEV